MPQPGDYVRWKTSYNSTHGVVVNCRNKFLSGGKLDTTGWGYGVVVDHPDCTNFTVLVADQLGAIQPLLIEHLEEWNSARHPLMGFWAGADRGKWNQTVVRNLSKLYMSKDVER